MAGGSRMRVANQINEKKILKRGNVPSSLKDTNESKAPVGPYLLALFIFVVCGSAIFEIIMKVQAFAGQKLSSRRKSVLKGKNYNDCMKDIGTVYNVQDFWKLYSFMKRPSKIDDSCDLMLFKRGIRPVWEEAANKDGGRWTLRVRRHNTDRYWENAIMAMIGEQFLVGDEICGIVLSLRNPWDQLSIWHRNSVDKFVVKKISESLKRILNLNVNSASGPQMDYRPHNETLNKAEQRRTSRDERRRNTSSDQDSEEKSSS